MRKRAATAVFGPVALAAAVTFVLAGAWLAVGVAFVTLIFAQYSYWGLFGGDDEDG